MKRSASLACYTGVERELLSETHVEIIDVLAWRLAGGDPGAPRELVECHHAELYRYARVLLRDGHVAEDAVQATFERVSIALGKYPRQRIEALALRPWLYRITLNVIRNTWRQGRRELTVAGTPERTDAWVEMGSTGASGTYDREDWLDVLEALGQLSERQRVAVTLRYLEDLPYAEIAGITGWPENTCKTLVRRGIARLGTLLGEPGEEHGETRSRDA